MTLPELLRDLDRAGLLVKVKGGHLAVSPKSRLTRELREEIILHRRALLDLFRDPPAWPPPHGRSGPAGDWFNIVGDRVLLQDGRERTLRAVLYETRSGRVRCRVDLPDGTARTVDPEDLLPAGLAATASEKPA